MSPPLVKLCKDVLPDARLFNDYGPTEFTVVSTGASFVQSVHAVHPNMLISAVMYIHTWAMPMGKSQTKLKTILKKKLTLQAMTQATLRAAQVFLLGSQFPTAAPTCWTSSCSWCRWACRAS